MAQHSKILALVLLFTPIAASAADSFDEIEYINTSLKESAKKPVTPEEMMTYFRLGKSVVSSEKNKSAYVGSIGYKRIPDSFSYGFEYSYHVIGQEYRYNDYSLTLGYKPQLNHRVAPYVSGGFGLATGNNISNGSGSGASGISYFYDIGLDFIKASAGNFKFQTMVGLKQTKIMLSGENQSGFTDLYFSVGVGW